MLSPHQGLVGVGLAPGVHGGVLSHIGRSAPPVPELEGPSFGTVSFHCRRPAAVGRAGVCPFGQGAAVPMMPPRVFMGACSWLQLAVV